MYNEEGIPEKKKIDWGIVALIGVAVAFVAFFVGFGIWADVEQKEYDAWYASLSEEEKLQVQQEKEAAYNANIYTYEVLSVAQYVKTETNNFGGILDTEICYTFTYLDGGTLKSVDSFRHLEYGLTKVAVGETNCYIINTNGETTRTLQLTKETLSNMQTLTTG